MRVALGLTVGAAVVLAAFVGNGNAASPASCGKLLPPAQGVYFGVMPGWEFSLPSYDDVADPNVVRTFESYTGRKVAFAPWSISWHERLTFPRAAVIALWRAGYVPQVRVFTFPVQDYAPSAPPPSQYPGPITSSGVAAGKFDDELGEFARAARATNIPISFDYNPEMDSAHPWGGRFDGGGTPTSYGDPTWPDGPEHFRDAYRRIVTIFREAGATNVTFFFQPNTPAGYVEGSYYPPWERYRRYYPGDEYMDWLGLSVYAEPKFQVLPNESFEDKLAFPDQPGYEGPYAEITALGAKPLSINELGLYNMPSEEAKARWALDASSVLTSGRYARIGAVNWWAQNKGQGTGYDAYPNTSLVFLNGFRAAFNQPFFDAQARFSGDCRPLKVARVSVRRGVLSWRAVPNASAYEVWRGSKRLARTSRTLWRVGHAPGRYRVRGVNIAGYGPFS
ncbi:MAG: hypothetical protein ACJ74D_00085 [Gaiellaceae bacterium]